MPHYQLFGGNFRSEIDFPELTPASPGPVNWTLERVSTLPTLHGLTFAGCEEVQQGVSVTLYCSEMGQRLAFDDTGIFDVTDGGGRMTWTPPAAPTMDAVRKDVLGRVFAVALDQAGTIALHGSAVAMGDVAIAFLAPKFHGKSTTAAALVNAGGRLLADDLVPITLGCRPLLLPSVPMVQLWRDSADRVAGSAAPLLAAEQSPKLQVMWKAKARNATTPVPLGAVYLLSPSAADSADGVRRVPLTGVEAALALLGQGKVSALLGRERRMHLLDRLIDLSGAVTVYRLEVPRDFNRIGELTNALQGWHPGASAAEGSA